MKSHEQTYDLIAAVLKDHLPFVSDHLIKAIANDLIVVTNEYPGRPLRATVKT